MKKLISIFILFTFVVISNALVFTTTDGRIITGTIKSNDARSFVVNTDKGMVVIYKNQVATLLDDNGVDVKAGLIAAGRDNKLENITVPGYQAPDISKMTDREFALYMNAQQTKAINRISDTMWIQFDIIIVLSIVLYIVLSQK